MRKAVLFQVKGFQLDYLAKVPEVKDTVHKQSLLYHLCCMVMEKFPNSSDFYSDLGALHRSSRVMCMFIPSSIIIYSLKIKCNDSLQNHEFCLRFTSLKCWKFLQEICFSKTEVETKKK